MFGHVLQISISHAVSKGIRAVILCSNTSMWHPQLKLVVFADTGFQAMKW